MRNLIARFPLSAYYLTAFLIVVMVVAYWQVGAMVYERNHGEPFDLFGFLYRSLDDLGYLYPNLVATIHVIVLNPWLGPSMFFGLAPTIAAVCVRGISDGRLGLVSLFSRLKPKGKSASWLDTAKCYGLIIVSAIWLFGVFLQVQAVMGASTEASAGGTGGVARSLEIVGWPALGAMAGALLIAMFLDEGGLLEELGWRGFALPLLLERFSPLRASVVVGLLWAGWHLPREVAMLLSSDIPAGFWILKQVDSLASGVAVSIIMTYFFALSGGSVIPAVMIHGLANFFSKTFYYDGMPLYLENLRFQTGVEIALSVLVLVTAGPRLGIPEIR